MAGGGYLLLVNEAPEGEAPKWTHLGVYYSLKRALIRTRPEGWGYKQTPYLMWLPDGNHWDMDISQFTISDRWQYDYVDISPIFAPWSKENEAKARRLIETENSYCAMCDCCVKEKCFGLLETACYEFRPSAEAEEKYPEVVWEYTAAKQLAQSLEEVLDLLDTNDYYNDTVMDRARALLQKVAEREQQIKQLRGE